MRSTVNDGKGAIVLQYRGPNNLPRDNDRLFNGLAIKVARRPEDREWEGLEPTFILFDGQYVGEILARTIAMGLLLGMNAYEARITDLDGRGSAIYQMHPDFA
jgi:hypothetical protein